jgi:surface polysaccharide O-acyltransferase-like enzyme
MTRKNTETDICFDANHSSHFIMKNRLHFIDNLRVFTIFIVVYVHSAVTYSGIGGWYYVEHAHLGNLEQLAFFLFQSHTQAFDMSLFFFIAGYFVPASLARKGTGKFISGRLYRLGIPLLFYVFVLQPLCVKLVHPQTHINEFYLNGLKHFTFPEWTGPLWFVLVLLVFSIIYALFARFLSQVKGNNRLSTGKLLAIIAVITLAAFLIRLVAPIGTSFMNLQFCFFAAYIVMFLLGTEVRRQGLVEKISGRMGRRWLIAAFAIGLPLWISPWLGGNVPGSKMQIFGGMNLPAFLYALWESFFCVAFIVALLGITQAKFNRQGRWIKFLSDNTFGVYVFHAPILISISLLLKDVHIDPFAKFLMIGTATIAITTCVSWAIRKIPVAGAIFD